MAAPPTRARTWSWWAAETPPDVVKRIQEECLKALRSPAVSELFSADNAGIGGGPSAEFSAYIAREQKIWSQVVKNAQIKPD